MASITLLFSGQEIGTYELDKPLQAVGREPSCEIHIDNLGISRRHCEFYNKGETFLVKDLGSANGTWVNGKRVTEHYLNHGDEVVIGKYVLKFHNETQVNQAAPAHEAVGVPDTLNTYVMDGSKIQEQLARMRAQAGESGGTPTAGDYAEAARNAAMPDGQASGGSAKIMLGAALVIIFILIAVIAYLMIAK